MEFQAIVMAAGVGSRIRELTSSLPKCLLPVGNVPLILCSLNILKQAGFKEVIILVQENEKSKIQNSIENKLDLKLDVIAVPKNEDWGTADSLRYIKDKIVSDILILSCDLVSDIDLQNMASLHRSKSSFLTILLVPVSKTVLDIEVPGYKRKCKLERDIVGLESNGRLVFMNSEADFEEGVPLKLNILKHYPQIKIHSDLMDAHVYMVKKDLVNFIINSENISTLKGEFIPNAVKKQFVQRSQILQANNIANMNVSAFLTSNPPTDLRELAVELSSWNDNAHMPKKFSNEGITCFSYVSKTILCSRVNSLVTFVDINRKISKNFSLTGQTSKPHGFPKSQVDNESIVGENCDLGVKSSVKQSMVGINCKIMEKSRITTCIIMENVHVGKECKIQNSIICSNAIVEDGCSLINCIIGYDQVVKESSKLSNEVLQCADQLLEI